tara:strand:- start:667 stop:1500 length:834 start_codon:yes stop_codon:yes gene_type:complete
MSKFFSEQSAAAHIAANTAGECAICERALVFGGNNGAPLIAGKVCNKCNTEVINFRMGIAMGSEWSCNADMKCLTLKLAARDSKVAVQKGLIEALTTSVEAEKSRTQSYKDELDEIAREECVAPMMDRVMADAKKDVDAVEAKCLSLKEENRVNEGHRCQNHRCLTTCAEGLFLSECQCDIDNFMEQLNDEGADARIHLSVCIPHPTRPSDDAAKLCGIKQNCMREHMRAERFMIGEIVRKFVVGAVKHTPVVVGEVRVCDFCEDCNSMKITLTNPQ